MTAQLDLFVATKPTPAQLRADYERRLAAWEPAGMVDRDQHGRPRVKTRAASHGGLITLYHPDAALPVEVTVRGVPSVVSFHGGFCTHAIEPVGSLYWSETGFRSFCVDVGTDPATIAAEIERYIDAPRKDGHGCGGKLAPWWPSYALDWRNNLAWELQHRRNSDAEFWTAHDRRQQSNMEKMRLEGIDPAQIDPPSHFRGKWPDLAQGAMI